MNKLICLLVLGSSLQASPRWTAKDTIDRLFSGFQILVPILAGGFPASAGCTTPTGANFTESFGDSATSCWAAGPSSCDHTWTIGAGTAQSIVASPAGAPSNTACSNSLNMNEPGGSAAYLSINFTGIAGAFDVRGTLYVTSAVSSGNSNILLCTTTNAGTCDTAGTIAGIDLDNNSSCTGVGVFGSGSTNSTCISVSLNTWYTFDLHRDTVAASCSVSLNGGVAQPFTCNTGTAATMYIGTEHFGTNAATFDIGNLFF